ncbi:MAG: hypothetical protein K6U88_06545, partial [Dehalococcoidia bacterium]|nr:hypothetical protein [Dehalococcoidia bacterium]
LCCLRPDPSAELRSNLPQVATAYSQIAGLKLSAKLKLQRADRPGQLHLPRRPTLNQRRKLRPRRRNVRQPNFHVQRPGQPVVVESLPVDLKVSAAKVQFMKLHIPVAAPQIAVERQRLLALADLDRLGGDVGEQVRRAVDAVSAAAKQKNLDGASLAYMQMTLNCVRCHKYLRSNR